MRDEHARRRTRSYNRAGMPALPSDTGTTTKAAFGRIRQAHEELEVQEQLEVFVSFVLAAKQPSWLPGLRRNL